MIDSTTRRGLLSQGYTVRGIAAAVHRGDLIRARRGNYLARDAPADLVAAVRVGGRLTCVNELRARGVWVVDDHRVHIRAAPNASRLRDPGERSRPYRPDGRCRLHWSDPVDDAHARRAHVSTVDALVDAARCLPTPWLRASLDSAVRIGAIGSRGLRLLQADPVIHPLLARIDTSAASGLETIARELARHLGFAVRTQFAIDGVGFVDLVVEDWIVVETDGAEFHTGAAFARDRRRDAVVASTGRTPLRFSYAQLVHDPAVVTRALIAAVASHRRVRNSGQKARTAWNRARRAGLA